MNNTATNPPIKIGLLHNGMSRLVDEIAEKLESIERETAPLPTKAHICTGSPSCNVTDCHHFQQHEHSILCAGGCFGTAHCEPSESCDFCGQTFPESLLVYHDDMQACQGCVKVNGAEFYKRG